METEIKIDAQYEKPKAVIYASEITQEVRNAVRTLSQGESKILTGTRDGTVEIIDEDTVIHFFTEDGRVWAQTANGKYAIKPRLYELEERLDRTRFVRISSSEIINLKKVSRFDLSLAGTVCVIFSDGGSTYASRRYVAKLKSILGM